MVNGKQPTEGRLEITKNGVTGSVCGGDSFKEDEARVVCKSLGHRYDTDSKATVVYASLGYRNMKVSEHRDKLLCMVYQKGQKAPKWSTTRCTPILIYTSTSKYRRARLYLGVDV